MKICYPTCMARLFVEKTIEIHAPDSKVWDVLTGPDLIVSEHLSFQVVPNLFNSALAMFFPRVPSVQP